MKDTEELAQAIAEARAYVAWATDAGVSIIQDAVAAPSRAQPAPPRPRLTLPEEPVPTPKVSATASAIAKSSRPAGLALPTLAEVRTELGECTRCKLSKGRNKIVFGAGSAQARLVFVGEAPGEDEDQSGEPFVGKAGQLLTKMIEAMGLSRDTVYICNTVKCRPPNNRNPEPDELGACEPFLKGQLAALQPEVIVTLGKFAAQALLRDQTPISRLRGTWREYEGVALMPTFHPAYLLRSPGEKGKVWGDLQEVMKKLGLRT